MRSEECWKGAMTRNFLCPLALPVPPNSFNFSLWRIAGGRSARTVSLNGNNVASLLQTKQWRSKEQPSYRWHGPEGHLVRWVKQYMTDESRSSALINPFVYCAMHFTSTWHTRKQFNAYISYNRLRQPLNGHISESPFDDEPSTNSPTPEQWKTLLA